jgi:transcriptional regulator
MLNYLNLAMIDLILSLRRKGWFQRRIVRELDLNRETVARYLKQARGNLKP